MEVADNSRSGMPVVIFALSNRIDRALSRLLTGTAFRDNLGWYFLAVFRGRTSAADHRLSLA